MPQRRLRWIDGGVVLLTGLVVAGMFARYTYPGRPVLVLWSCGGNYDSLSELVAGFERRHQCRVRYTGAPVEYLLEKVAFGGGRPDLIVGRAGPGWAALIKLGKLAEGPDFFAADPFVIITPAGNPAHIRTIEDLGRPGVRVAYAPDAMRPKGKCPGHLMGMVADQFSPGLDERWENNAVAPMRCGRDLPDAIVAGRADAAIVARSMTGHPAVKAAAVEVIPIGIKYLDAMQVCRATIGQCVGILRDGRQPELARQFRDEMLGDPGREVFSPWGYFHITSPEVEEYRAFLKTSVPKRMPPWQVHLADRLEQAGLKREAIRRHLTVIHTFGPNEAEAYCRWRVGELLAAQGKRAEAASQWRRLIRDFPRLGPHEYASPVFDLVSTDPKLNLEPEAGYVEKARQALGPVAGAGYELAQTAMRDALTEPPSVLDGDPPKNGKREFALGEDLFLTGDYEFATRDYLKVLHLCYPSRCRPEASYKIGMCDHLRGYEEVAGGQWRWTTEQFPGTRAARRAAAALERVGDLSGGAPTGPGLVPMPPWEPKHDTWPQRGMSYGMALYEHQLPLFALKEMVKLIHDVYKPPGRASVPEALKAEARYRAGVCALAAGHPAAAILEWRMCRRDYRGSPWAGKSAEAVAAVLAAPGPAQAAVRAAAYAPLPKISMRDKPACWQRYSLGDEFLQLGILDEGQAALEFLKALTVTHASKGKYDQAVVPPAEAKLEAALCSE